GPFGIQERLNTQRFSWEYGANGHTTPSPAALSPASANVQVIATGLVAPWAIDFAPDGRVFVTERPGRIRVLQAGTLRPDPWAVLPVSQQAGSEKGLLGLAVDP